MFTLLQSSEKDDKREYLIRPDSSLKLECGVTLPEVRIAFQTWGTLNDTQTNVIWVCHALTGNQRVQEWWDGLFGTGKYLNPEEYFIVCVNTLGSAYGTTSAVSEYLPDTLKTHRFPVVTNRDVVKVFDWVRDFLQLERIGLLIGASLGGQQAMEWAVHTPELFDRLILIATNAKHAPFGIAFNEAQRMAIEADPTYFSDEPEGGKEGLKAARAIGMLSYRTYQGYEKTQSEPDHSNYDGFRSSGYQRYQGEKLAKRFQAHAYWTLTKSMDSHNVFRGRTGNPFQACTMPVLVIGIDTDILFPLSEQQTLVAHFPRGQLQVIHSDFGHDGFLVAYEQLITHLQNFLNN